MRTLLEMTVQTGDNGGSSVYIIIGVVCVVALVVVAILGSKAKDEESKDENEKSDEE